MSTKINWLCPKCGAKGETISEGDITEPITCTRCGTAAAITAREEGDFNKFASDFHILPTDKSAPLRWKCSKCEAEGSATLAQLASYQCYCPSCDQLLSPMDVVGVDSDLDFIEKEEPKPASGVAVNWRCSQCGDVGVEYRTGYIPSPVKCTKCGAIAEVAAYELLNEHKESVQGSADSKAPNPTQDKIGAPEVSCSDCRTYSPTTVEAFMDDPTCPNCGSANCILHIPNAGTIKSGFFDGYVGFPDQKPMSTPECTPYEVTGIVAEREVPNPTTESDPLDGVAAGRLIPETITPDKSAVSYVGLDGKYGLTLFAEAEQTINGPRAEDYGDASESFDRIAALWSAYLNTPISSADVAMLMSLLKMVRLKYSKFAHHDSFVDLLGYVGLAHKVSGEK